MNQKTFRIYLLAAVISITTAGVLWWLPPSHRYHDTSDHLLIETLQKAGMAAFVASGCPFACPLMLARRGGFFPGICHWPEHYWDFECAAQRLTFWIVLAGVWLVLPIYICERAKQEEHAAQIDYSKNRA